MMIRRLAAPALLLLAGYYAIFGGGYSVLDLNRIHHEIAERQIERDDLRAETLALEARAEALETDPRALERIARERFGMIRDGEVLYRFAGSGEGDSQTVDRGGIPR